MHISPPQRIDRMNSGEAVFPLSLSLKSIMENYIVHNNVDFEHVDVTWLTL